MLKVAVVGVGVISSVHIKAWDSMDDAELVALCDVRPEQMEKYEGKHKYTDIDEMLKNEKIDILDICVPTFLHVDFAVKAMEMGINVLCEKPISLKKEDVARVYGCAEKNGVKFMVAQVLRFFGEYCFVKELFDTQRYGKLVCGTMSRIEAHPLWSWDNWYFDEKRSGLVPYDLHIHDLDWLVYTFGKPLNHKSYRAKSDGNDYINISYEFDGFFINCEAAWFAAKKFNFNAGFKFQFEKALVTLKDGKLMVFEKDGEALDFTPGAVSETGDKLGIPATNGYADEIRYFADCVKANTFPDKVKPEELSTVIDILNSIV